MRARGSSVASGVLTAAMVLVAIVLIHSGSATRAAETEQEAAAVLVRQLGLTDLALFTEARYTRHPSQADLHSASQDHPMSLDHFPTGSLIAPKRDSRASGFVDTDRKDAER